MPRAYLPAPRSPLPAPPRWPAPTGQLTPPLYEAEPDPDPEERSEVCVYVRMYVCTVR